MGMGFAPTWLRQVSLPPPASQNHFNHCTHEHDCTGCIVHTGAWLYRLYCRIVQDRRTSLWESNLARLERLSSISDQWDL